MTDITPEEMHAIDMASPASVPVSRVLPGTAKEVEQTVAENNIFRSRTKLPRKHGMTLGLVTRAFDRLRVLPDGETSEKTTKYTEQVLFGLTPAEKHHVYVLLNEFREWERNPAAYTNKAHEPTQQSRDQEKA